MGFVADGVLGPCVNADGTWGGGRDASLPVRVACHSCRHIVASPLIQSSFSFDVRLCLNPCLPSRRQVQNTKVRLRSRPSFIVTAGGHRSSRLFFIPPLVHQRKDDLSRDSYASNQHNSSNGRTAVVKTLRIPGKNGLRYDEPTFL